MIFFDTESVGKTGPLVLIQFAFLSDLEQCKTEEDYKRVIKIHHVWDNSVEETLKVIEGIITWKEGICGFNLAHDVFMLNKWYNVFRSIPAEFLSSNPEPKQIHTIETVGPRQDDACLKPVTSLDLLIVAKSTKYQYLAKHKNVYIKKVPVDALGAVIDELNHTNERLPSGIRVRWRVGESKKYNRHDVKDVVGEFFPSSSFDAYGNLKPGGAKKRTFASLKQLIGIIRNDPSLAEKDFESEVGFPSYDEEPDWKPWGGSWENATKYLAKTFRHNETAINYARNDIIYTYELWLDLGRPKGGDDDSELASLVGAMQWKGFAVANEEVLRGKIIEYTKSITELRKLGVNANSPTSVRDYLTKCCTNDLEALAITDTKKTTLEELSRWEGHPIQNAVKLVKKARQAEKRKNILQKLIEAKRFTFSMKVSGTLSNRMSGGQEVDGSTESSGGKLNAQGIPRVKDFRALFLLAFPDETLEGGDFSAFEPCILDALVQDPQFRQDLSSGIKIHVFVGAEFYNCDPSIIVASEGTEDDKYIRSKNGFLGWIYGAMQNKVAKVLDLPERDVEQGYQRIKKRYPVLSNYRDNLLQRFSPVRRDSDDEMTGKIIWEEPDGFIESKRLPWQEHGFKRSFILEWTVIQGIFRLASELSLPLLQISGTIRRSNRVQTIPNAVRSALFASIFSYQSHVFRAAANHEIQSPGAQITKRLQRLIWDLQPCGISNWVVRPMNNHDEVMVCCSMRKTESERLDTGKEGLCQSLDQHQHTVAPTAEESGAESITVKSVTHSNPTLLSPTPQEVQAKFIDSLVRVIPQLRMKWKTNLKNWAEK